MQRKKKVGPVHARRHLRAAAAGIFTPILTPAQDGGKW